MPWSLNLALKGLGIGGWVGLRVWRRLGRIFSFITKSDVMKLDKICPSRKEQK